MPVILIHNNKNQHLATVDKLGENRKQEEATCGVVDSCPIGDLCEDIYVCTAQQQPSSCFQEHHVILMCGWAGVAAITRTQWEQYLHQVHANSSALVAKGPPIPQKFSKVRLENPEGTAKQDERNRPNR